MGLGKTVQVIALILASPPPAHVASKPRFEATFSTKLSSGTSTSKTTLIIMPVAVMNQWKAEIQSKTDPAFRHLSILVHHGPNRTKDPRKLAQYDVVLTTYGLVTSSLKEEGGSKDKSKGKAKKPIVAGPDGVVNLVSSDIEEDDETGDVLTRVKFFRIVLDEAHIIKNHSSKGSKACAALKAERRVCLTGIFRASVGKSSLLIAIIGTPIQNNLDELYSLLRFLQVPAFSSIKDFQRVASNPTRLQDLLSSIMLRRTKAGLGMGTSPPIPQSTTPSPTPQPAAVAAAVVTPQTSFSMHMPPKMVTDVLVRLRPSEEVAYRALEERNQRAVKQGGEAMSHMAVLVLLMRLRQMCNHSRLAGGCGGGSSSNGADAQEEDARDDLDGLADAVAGLSVKGGSDGGDERVRKTIPWLQRGPLPSFKKKVPVEVNDCVQVFESMKEGEELDSLEDLVSQMRISEKIERAVTVNQNGAKKEVVCCLSCGTELSPETTNSIVEFCSDCSSAIPSAVKTGPLSESNWISSSKIDKMMEIITEKLKDSPDDKFIVFSQWTSMLDILEIALKKLSVRFVRYDGKMTSTIKEKALTKFRTDASCSVCIMSLMCGSLGLNLTCANNVILTDLWWNPMLEDQAVDRVFRMGQQKPVHVHRMIVENSVEERIVALQKRKRDLVESTIGGKDGFKGRKLSFGEMIALIGL
ncbi:P-loop containing nucleoside triphosphate hydrolase protein [Chytriomyces sp. MP71]|nr:P-loop containing nucleoside triphosphate hydrolase protein [Chytriomyces sp. MP71]